MRTLFAGPFDGFEYAGPLVEFLELDAHPLPLPGETMSGTEPDSVEQVRYYYRVTTNRYEWEGLHHGR